MKTFNVKGNIAIKLGICHKQFDKIILLPIICDDLPVENQLRIRFLKSIKSNMNTDNELVKLCARLCVARPHYHRIKTPACQKKKLYFVRIK